MNWVTRENVRVGRAACAWLIQTHVDQGATIAYVSREEIAEHTEAGATAFHVKGSEYEHTADRTPFEAMLAKHGLDREPAFALMGRIINGADTSNTRYNQPEGPGVRAIVEGLRRTEPGDQQIIDASRPLFDALYAYCVAETASVHRAPR